uniref:Decapping nuclease n=1 Tax=Panagrolaimus sp. ES5 TaxID=591445 RepID=A0AC34G9F4_9BILA
MTYFGISNLNNFEDPFINNINLFPNISEEVLLHNIKNNKIYDISINYEDKVRLDDIYNYDPTPVLFQHRNNEALKNIWKNINHGDIITNRASKRALTDNNKEVIVEKKWIDFNDDEHDKMIYLIKKSDFEINVPIEKLHMGMHAPTIVFNNLSNQSYTVYRYMKSYNKGLQCYEHYTCEIDGFVKTEINNKIIYKPVEFKTMENVESQKQLDIDTLWNGVKTSIGVQCKLSDIDNVIFGFRDELSMKLKYCDVTTITNGIEYKVRNALNRMEKNTIKIIRKYYYS